MAEAGSKGDAGEIGEGLVEFEGREELSRGALKIVEGIGKTQIRSRSRLCCRSDRDWRGIV